LSNQFDLRKSLVEGLGEGIRSFPFCITLKRQDGSPSIIKEFFSDKTTPAPLRHPAVGGTSHGNDKKTKQTEKDKPKNPHFSHTHRSPNKI
jgi:hypothetical protein